MNISTNERKSIGGALADGLTLFRALITPVIMALIIFGWPNNQVAALVTLLIALAALSDIFDNLLGGTEHSRWRLLGRFDDVADTVLYVGTLIALLFVFYRDGGLNWFLAVPAIIVIAREIIVGLAKGSTFSQTGWPETRYGAIKTGLIMLAISFLVAAPWLSNWINMALVTSADPMTVYTRSINYVWLLGEALLWVAALFSVITGFQLLTASRPLPDNTSISGED